MIEFYNELLADGNQRIWIRDKMLEFSSLVLPAPMTGMILCS